MERSVAPERLALFCGAKDPAACAKAALLCEEEFSRGEYLLRAGEACAKFGAVLAGSVYVVREDERGDPVTVANIGAGETFAEAFAFAGMPAAAGAVAAERCRIAWFSPERLLAAEGGAVAANLLRAFARKNMFLTERIEHLSRRSLSQKVLSYLRSAQRAAGKATFSVPFDRQGLADYLGCDRSALSAVLAKLKAAGVLDYHKNAFRLL